MTDSPPIQLAAEPLFSLSAVASGNRMVAGLPLGDRMIIDISGGEFEGPRLSGKVLASGGDWLTLTSAGARLDVRLVLETSDGVTLLLRYSGIASEKSGAQRADVAGYIEAPVGPYAWLNSLHVLGFGRAVDGVAKYDFFHLL
jgi:hypothetical protein